MLKTYSVYVAVCTITGRSYVGYTGQTLAHRRGQHLDEARSGTQKCRYFHSALRKYGADAFTWTVVYKSSAKSKALAEEIRLISEIKDTTGGVYNLTAGGEAPECSEESRNKMSIWMSANRLGPNNPNYGKPRDPTTREKIRVSNTGQLRSAETKQILSESHKGLRLSEQSKQKISVSLTGRVRSTEHCENIAKSKKGHTVSEATRKKISDSLKARNQPKP